MSVSSLAAASGHRYATKKNSQPWWLQLSAVRVQISNGNLNNIFAALGFIGKMHDLMIVYWEKICNQKPQLHQGIKKAEQEI